MDKQSTIRTIRASYKIDQVENGWTVATSDGNMFVFADSKELAEWFCMIVGFLLTRRSRERIRLNLRSGSSSSHTTSSPKTSTNTS